MDPLSIIASAITIAQVVGVSLDQVCKFCAAEAEVLGLINETSDLRLALEELSEILKDRERQGTSQRDNVLAVLLKRIFAELEGVNKALKDGVVETNSRTGKVTVSPFAWVRKKSKITRRYTQLREMRQTISRLCSNVALSDTSRIQVQIDSLAVLQQDAAAQLKEQTRILKSLEQQPQSITSGALPTVAVIPNITPSDPASTGQMPASPPPALNDAVQVRVTRYKSSCNEWCSCHCHKIQAVRTPSIARDFLGLLFIGYTGLPYLKGRCSEKNCKQRGAPRFRLTYYFPSWFTGRMLQIALSRPAAEGLRVSLEMPRVIPDMSEVFLYACQGKIAGMQSLFDRKLASPFDIGSQTGRTPLHYAVNYDHPDLARFLLDIGAKRDAEDKEQATPVSLAWRRIFGVLSEPLKLTSFHTMFEDGDFLDSRGFPSLHKIVLGLSGASLQELLSLSTKEIDDVDVDGRTALSWAATRNGVAAVRTLLAFRADPTLASHWGQLPLHHAVLNKKDSPIEIIEELISHGSDVTAVDYWGRTALCYAIGNCDDLAIIKLLVSKGTAVNKRDCRLRTPLGYAARLGNHEHAAYLIGRGADTSIPDEYNVIPICDAVKNNFHEILRLLLPISKATDTQPLGSSLLHWVAGYADEDTLKIILQGTFCHLFRSSHVSRLNAENLTPADVFDNRSGVQVPVREYFADLMVRVASLDATAERVDHQRPTSPEPSEVAGSSADGSLDSSEEEFWEASEVASSFAQVGI